MSGSGSLKLAPSLAQHLNRLGYVKTTGVSANERLNGAPRMSSASLVLEPRAIRPAMGR